MRRSLVRHALSVVSCLSLAACMGASVTNTDTDAQPSDPQARESLVVKGSDTEVQLVSNLAEAFAESHPDASISVTGGGSATGIAGLLNGELQIANSSREMNQEELDQAKAKGLDVKEFILARDGLSVIVHPGNTVKQLTLDEISKIYKGEIKNWKDVGGADKPIVLYGRQSTSGTYSFFRSAVVKADYSTDMRNMEGSQAIVDAVKADEGGIGYVGVGYVKDEAGAPRADIMVLPVEKEDGTTVSPLDKAAVMAGEYPIFRPIFQYLASAPSKGSLLEDFLLFEASAEGQALVEKTGFYSVTEADTRQNDAFFATIK